MVWSLGQARLREEVSPPWLVLDYEGPGLVMIYRVVELPVFWTTVTNLTVELTAANTWPLTDPAGGNLLKILVIIIGICDVKDGGEPGDLLDVLLYLDLHPCVVTTITI